MDHPADAASPPGGSGRWVFISPHLDDGVFACGEALAAQPGAVVVTVFAGCPADATQSTDWDARCGFADARSAIAARRAEDRAALAMLGARPHWLDFLDSQYGDTPARAALAEALGDVLDDLQASTVAYPLGLFHSDHRLVHEAARDALARRVHMRALVYEDALYRAIPGCLQARLAELLRDGFEATPAPMGDTRALAQAKVRAVQLYASQLRAFGPDGYGDTRAPERAWRLAHRATIDADHG